ncbi:plexin domain-containing protein 1-like [Cloeon dipterum]|uniref:plexin domain-containing protein 1-like n=1 Tax=Cloeon dipterum TaxID=197152 RepID=UPI00322005F5
MESISLGYHFDVNNYHIRNATVVRFEPVPLCLHHYTCASCASSKIQTYLHLNESHPCFWCPDETQSLSVHEQDIWDEYNSLRIQYTPVDADFAEKSWAFVENHTKTVAVTRMTTNDAIVTDLSFGFPFYDVIISKALIVSGLGSISAFVNSSWAIFPFVASEASSSFTFVDTGDSFHVNWEDFILNDTSYKDAMKFQASLFENGTIQFVYMKVPKDLTTDDAISTHEISIGVAYKHLEKFDKGRNETHHLGHSIGMKKFKIQDGTVIRFEPLPSCTKYKDCKSCVNAIIPMFRIICNNLSNNAEPAFARYVDGDVSLIGI